MGLDSAAARELLEYYGMKVTLLTVRDLAPEGTVITQSPSAEEAIGGTGEIILTVSGGPTYSQTVEMMNFVGQTLSRAEAILDYMFEGVCEYKITVRYEQSLKPRDTILSQTPAAGKVSLTSGVLEIVFNLSGGPGYIPPDVEFPVPFVEGLSLADAEIALRAAGISVGNVSYIVSGAPAGFVVLQSAAPGSIIMGQPGRVSIDLTVSLGSSEIQP
jgi:beta-lactam-binding protein with PASTA domain